MGARWFGRRGLGRGQGAVVGPEQEKGWLRQQAELLKGQLEGITRRLDELDKQGK